MTIARKYYLLSFIFVITLNFSPLYSEEDQNSNVNFDTFEDSLLMKGIFSVPIRIIRFRINDNYDEPQYYDYTANTLNSLGCELAWKDIDVKVYKKLRDDDFEDDYGKTDYYNLGFSWFRKNFGILSYYQHIEGFYLNDNGDPADIRRDISVKDAGLSLMWKFDEKFSYNAAITQMDRQRFSSGSLFIGIQFNYLDISMNRSPVPQTESGSFDADANNFRGGAFYSVTPYIGFACTFVYLKNFYLSLGLAIGSSFSYNKWKFTNGEEAKYWFAFMSVSTPGWITLGYNGDSFLYGLNFKYIGGVSNQLYFTKGVGIEAMSSIDIELFLGMRL